MNCQEQRSTSRKRSASWLAPAAALLAASVWICISNFGCISESTVMRDTWSYWIEMNPGVFPDAKPNESVESVARLLWSSAERPVDADWSIPTLPEGVTSATVSPQKGVDSTTVTVVAGNTDILYGASGVWSTSDAAKVLVPVNARFVDPVWNSLQKQEIYLNRKAYLELTSVRPKMTAKFTQIVPSYNGLGVLEGVAFKGTAEVVGAPPGWVFSFTVENYTQLSERLPEVVTAPDGSGQSVIFTRPTSWMTGVYDNAGDDVLETDGVHIEAHLNGKSDYWLSQNLSFSVPARR